ncbi:ATP-binding protein [Sedimentibacter hydroxybenzoicus DSM 7310]|uniref:ATP-binding protein n=1 Tax=Sedimentibacter hydroxybenzoicus DSM 7310 TaxID=1123245 RepID=A0A974BKP4_SEDHY|nr:ATP-binding protein [Sedimentibacter hydroxybenzoicus]NYB74636.1 ATP-binding protein [Sedimentibacter hydroxybenzoicus DSM 7310]
MNKQILENIMTEYNKKRLRAARNADIKKEKLYESIPELKDADDAIKLLSIRLSKLFLSRPDNLNEEVLKLKEEIDGLKKYKADIYTKYNLHEDYLDIEYECKKCNDTGYYDDGKKCSCLNKQIINSLYSMSNMECMLGKENFDAFDINVFSNETYKNEKLTPRQNMYYILEISEDFCSNFYDSNMNLLLYGSTGLGKTFMCNCIAKALINREISVLYQTSFSLFEIVENHKFNKQNESEENLINYNMIFECELLIIDDLGTEVSNSFTNAELFNIINERLINNKRIIISTNLSLEQLRDTYSDRITSRIFNNFVPLKFYGDDLRYKN